MLKIFQEIRKDAFKIENVAYAFTKKPLIHATFMAIAGGFCRGIEATQEAGTIPTNWLELKPVIFSALVCGGLYVIKNMVFGSGKKNEPQFEVQEHGGTIG